jgi:histidinol dehydrogenase
MPAGPSELLIADDDAVPAFVASDLLSQAEHGADSQVILVSTSKKIDAVEDEIHSNRTITKKRNCRKAIANLN